MNYPHFIDYTKFNDKHHKFYDIDIIERNCIYPFTYNNTNNVKSNIIRNDSNISNINNFIQLPIFENLILDTNGLPFIPLNK